MVTDNGKKPGFIEQCQRFGRLRPAVDQIAGADQAVVIFIKTHTLQLGVQRRHTTVQVADNKVAAFGVFT